MIFEKVKNILVDYVIPAIIAICFLACVICFFLTLWISKHDCSDGLLIFDKILLIMGLGGFIIPVCAGNIKEN